VQHFGSVRGVKEASLEALRSLVPPKMASAIFEYFHPPEAGA
jgi:excinuclease UvrABC nuclease subunit